MRGSASINSKNEMLIVYSNPFPRQNDGMNRRTHSKATAAVFRLGFGLATSAASIRRMREIKGPAIPMKKLNTMTNRLARDGDLKKKHTIYVKPAAAGPSNSRAYF